jgi:hypothetical protein
MAEGIIPLKRSNIRLLIQYDVRDMPEITY